jgi:hypothetical protein
MKRLSSAVLALLLLAASGARAADFTTDAIGTTGSDFLTQDIGARGIALGGAYTALTNDSNSLYWNPAGLAKVPRTSVSFMYTRYVQDISYQSINGATRVSDQGVIAGGIRYRDIGSIDHTDLSGSDMGTFHPRDYVTEAGWGQSIYDLSDSELDVYMGVAARWIHSTIIEHGDGYGGDIGIQSRLYLGQYAYDFGFVAQNMGLGAKFDQRRDTLPFRVRIGGAFYPIRELALSFEGIFPTNNVAHGAAGIEYTMDAGRDLGLAFRAGFNSLTVDSLDVFSGFSAGMGLKLTDFSFDYAFSPMGVLGEQVHRFSISYNLPAKISRRYRERY